MDHLSPKRAGLLCVMLAACSTASIEMGGSVALPLPTLPQLAWQRGEIMALIHFNMVSN
jgi:hypothetical protein